MAEGRLGSAVSSAGDEDVYTVPSGKTATVNIIISRVSGDATIVLYARDGAKSDEDVIWPSTLMGATSNSRIELTGVPLSGDEIVTLESDAVGISICVRGFEEEEVV